MAPQLFVLSDGEPVPCPPGRAWDRWYNALPGRRIAQTMLLTADVETYFTGISRTGSKAPAHLYETVVRASEALDLTLQRNGVYHSTATYASREEAERGHDHMAMLMAAVEERLGFR